MAVRILLPYYLYFNIYFTPVACFYAAKNGTHKPLYFKLALLVVQSFEACNYWCFDCRRDINHLYQLLAYARKIFHQIDTVNPVNVEAGKL